MEKVKKLTMKRFNRYNRNRQSINENDADCDHSKFKENQVLNQSEAKEESQSNFVTNFKEEKFTFVWRIENVHRCTLKSEEFLESPTFSTKFCDEIKWTLRFYPRGRRRSTNIRLKRPPEAIPSRGMRIYSSDYFDNVEDNDSEDVGLFLNRISTNPTNSSVRYRLSCERHILRSDKTLKEVHVYPLIGLASIEMGTANSSEYGKDDFYYFDSQYPETLVVKCDIYVTNVINKEIPGNQTADLLKSCTLCQDLKEMYETAKFSDVTLQARDVKIPAHKNILASRSRVFDAMFQHDTREAQTNVIQIEDVEPAVLISLLQYIYTGSVDDFNIEKAMSLYSVADKYLLEELKNWCAGMMLENMTIENVCHIAVLSDLYPSPVLKEAILSMFRTYTSDIFKRQEWQNLLRDANHHVLVSEILSSVSTDFITNCEDN